ncbi:sensor histidine kinase [Psychromonas sp. Urea-02u-13]|uniref:sensor histidine kinase n=1 Tax=Psychromonas sp. Urea-02u-13 TaxID=2058326 RepID=UPI001E56B274|nr:ATP-binding protein [Psychromonas sp. Urea-02u-13]
MTVTSKLKTKLNMRLNKVNSRRLPIVIFTVYCLVSLLAATWLWQFSYQRLTTSSQQQLELFSSHLDSQLERFAYLPQLLSRQSLMIDALLNPNNSAQRDIINRHLNATNQIIGASDTYLLNINGTTIAASNWSLEASFVGLNFAFRPYFQQAMKGKQGDYFALGSTSGRRGYYYSYPVQYAGEVIGVVVVKMDISSIEKDWSEKSLHFLVTDPHGIAFISTQPAWLFQSLGELSTAVKNAINQERRYLGKNIEALPFEGEFEQNPSLIRVSMSGERPKNYLVLTKEYAKAGWNVRVFVSTNSITYSIVILLVLLTLLFSLLYLVLVLIRQRQNRNDEKQRLQVNAKQELEFQVMQRTSALHAEIDERQKAELALKNTQKELIQAAKLAVLGQLSASISHELNNPLAAIRSYADNALVFLEREKIDKVTGNLQRITHLTERMARISAQLKAFARKSDGVMSIIALQPVLLATFELVKPQLKASQITLDMHLPRNIIQVKAEPIQLEQILVNLLSNAIQAMQDSEVKNINVTLSASAGKAVVEVIDTGPGIAESDIGQLFEPFFTTKETGLGLGLSISQQIINSMQGKLWAQNTADAGAMFSISLPLTSAPEIPLILPQNQELT